MSDRRCYFAVHLTLDVETHGNGLFVFHEQAFECNNLGILVFVKNVIHNAFKVATLYNFRHHISILVKSS